ncbi:MAG: ATP-binding protein [Polyangiaceae bacterium]
MALVDTSVWTLGLELSLLLGMGAYVGYRARRERDLQRRHAELREMLERRTRELTREGATVELLSNVTSTANQAESFLDAVADGARIVCEHLGWQVVHVCLIEPASKRVVSSGIWFGECQAFAEWRHANAALGLPQLVLTAQRPVAVRAPHSGLVGALHAGVGFPIVAAGQVVAVVEIYAAQAQELDAPILAILSMLGVQLGMVAERERRAAQLGKALEAARSAARQKSEFLSNMSHELRTPLHAILNYASLSARLVEGDESSKLRQYLSNVQLSGKRLLGLINGVLDLAKMDSGRLNWRLSDGSFEGVLDQTLLELEPLLHEKQIRLERPAPTCSSHAEFDEPRMVQVLMNLLSNAIKFSPEGSCIVVSLHEAQLHGESALECRVTDQGVGIPQDELETVFEMFHQSRRTQDGSGGTGLGLAICKQIVSAHRGQIMARSAQPVGTEIVMVFPRQAGGVGEHLTRGAA